MEYRDDIDNITTRWKIGYVIICVAIWGVFIFFSQQSRGLVAAGSFASIALTARVRWNLRNFSWFWWFLALATVLHIVAVGVFSGKIDVHPTIALAPLGIADYFALLYLLAALERKMRSRE